MVEGGGQLLGITYRKRTESNITEKQRGLVLKKTRHLGTGYRQPALSGGNLQKACEPKNMDGRLKKNEVQRTSMRGTAGLTPETKVFNRREAGGEGKL